MHIYIYMYTYICVNRNSNRERFFWITLKVLTYVLLLVQVNRRLYLDRSLEVILYIYYECL
jgi:hypothetical protein